MTTKCIQTFGGVFCELNYKSPPIDVLQPQIGKSEMRIPEISKGLVVSMDLN